MEWECKCGNKISEAVRFCSNCGKKATKPRPKPELAELDIRNMDPVLRTKEVAKLLKVSVDMVYELVWQKKIPYANIAKKPNTRGIYRFKTKDVMAWLENQDTVTTAG